LSQAKSRKSVLWLRPVALACAGFYQALLVQLGDWRYEVNRAQFEQCVTQGGLPCPGSLVGAIGVVNALAPVV